MKRANLKNSRLNQFFKYFLRLYLLLYCKEIFGDPSNEKFRCLHRGPIAAQL